MATRKVSTATLVRGQVYTLRHPDFTPQNPKESLRFQRNIPVVIEDPRILDILENMYDDVPDGDGEINEKPVFRINRNVDAPEEDQPRSRRLSADREVRTVPSGKKPLRLRK